MDDVVHAAAGPATSWARADWAAAADRLLDAARAWASPSGSQIIPPGEVGGYGRDVDGLEGFARTLLLAGFRLSAESIDTPHDSRLDELADFYRRGITAGVDPEAPDRWVRLDEHAQAKVEAASIALVLDMTREWIWDRLDALTQQRVIDYLAPVVGDDTYPRTNWLWFRIVVQTFLRSVGGPWSEADVAADLALHEELAREDGWISDGVERSYDHYVGWALHTYPVLWSRMRGAADLAGGRTASDVAALDRYLQDAIHLVGADGSPLIQGRSLIYRFAAAAPFWIGAIADVPSVSPGRLRTIAERIVGHFAEHGAPTDEGQLTLGWHHAWPALAQSYSGPGSPYWAVKGFLGLILPAEHPVWTAAAEPLPVSEADALRAVRSAGWIIATTADDGIARVVNHGTDHALKGAVTGDSPLYARIGYATAAAPLADAAAWEHPLEQSVALVDDAGRATHRAAMTLLDVRIEGEDDEPVGVAASTWPAHWMSARVAAHRHGSGIEGDIEIAGDITVVSFVRRAWEVRLARVDGLHGFDGFAVAPAGVRLRIGGWAVSGDTVEASAENASAEARCGAVRSRIRSLPVGSLPVGATDDARGAIIRRADASPLGPDSAVPVLELPVTVGAWTASLIELSGIDRVEVTDTGVDLVDGVATITWPDGAVTTGRIPTPGPAEAADR
ncbi:DUF2264 domain-containing protein [Marisediminicola sp. LYQ85]|uniref:DUF2264 domain-containing protein n=1 Tax=Marisediminicola sp. LYQ85 TaxID=3391062 RepID=UPI0039834B50